MAFTLAQLSNIRLGKQYNFVVTPATDLLSIFNHPFLTGDDVQLFTQSSSLPAPLSVASFYYVIVIDANHIKLATSLDNAIAGTAIDITTTGSNLHSVIKNIATFDSRIADQCLLTAYNYLNGILTLDTINAGLGLVAISDAQMREWCSRITGNPESWSSKMKGGILQQAEIITRGVFSLDADIATAVQKLVKSYATI